MGEERQPEQRQPEQPAADAFTAYQPPKAAIAPPIGQVVDDPTGGLIPYRNPPALIAYYFGIFSIIPCLGLLCAVPAVVLGVIGLRNRAANPAVKGGVHAWVGIGLGTIFGLLWLLAALSLFVGGLFIG